MNPTKKLKQFTGRYYCPCGKIYKQWLHVRGITHDTLGGKDMFEYCKNASFSDPNKFLRHMSTMALKNDPVHNVFFQHLQALYPKYLKEVFKKKKVRSNNDVIQLPMNIEKRKNKYSLFVVKR